MTTTVVKMASSSTERCSSGTNLFGRGPMFSKKIHVCLFTFVLVFCSCSFSLHIVPDVCVALLANSCRDDLPRP